MNNQLLYIVHSHELNQHWEPGQEYKPRLEQVCEDIQKEAWVILLTGWKATKGIDMRHCDSWRNFLVSQWINENLISLETDPHGSLETVGEALFARRDYGQVLQDAQNVILISSDYHEGRIMTIQEYILGETLWKKLKFEGIPVSKHGNSLRTPEMERKSLNAFRNTFAGIQMWDIDRLVGRLWRLHPLYVNHPSNPYKEIESK